MFTHTQHIEMEYDYSKINVTAEVDPDGYFTITEARDMELGQQLEITDDLIEAVAPYVDYLEAAFEWRQECAERRMHERREAV